MKRYCCYLLLCFFCFSCQEEEADIEDTIAQIEVNVPIQRLEKDLFACHTKKEVLDFLNKNKVFANFYFQTPSTGFDALAEELTSLLANNDLQRFYKQMQEPAFFQNLTIFETDFKEAFQHLRYYYPKIKIPKIYTCFSGFRGESLYVSDSLVIIGLDYFMGKKALFKPNVYAYEIPLYNASCVVPQMVLGLSNDYEVNDKQDNTLLKEMISFGKSYVFGQVMLPSKADSTFIPYTTEQLEETYAFQADVWGHFIDNQLLYSTKEPLKAKYIEPRPKTMEIGERCPGQIGRWLGWQIVRKYYEEQDITIQDLMKNANAQKILEQSKYRGEAED